MKKADEERNKADGQSMGEFRLMTRQRVDQIYAEVGRGE
jgi:hypothetical protein